MSVLGATKPLEEAFAILDRRRQVKSFSDSESKKTLRKVGKVLRSSPPLSETLLFTGKYLEELRHQIPEGNEKEQVFWLLRKYSTRLSTRLICQILEWNYDSLKGYIYKLRAEYKTLPDYINGINRISLHHQHYYGRVVKSLDRRADHIVTILAIEAGWIDHRSKNKMLIWKDRDGWVKWWESGKIREFVHKPANDGKKKQILANAFYKTFLMSDLALFDVWADSIKLHDGHLVYETDKRLPYARIELLRGSHGVVVTIGDKSNPSAVEIQWSLPTWAEDFEILTHENIGVIKQFNDFLRDLSQPKPPDREQKYIS